MKSTISTRQRTGFVFHAQLIQLGNQSQVVAAELVTFGGEGDDLAILGVDGRTNVQQLHGPARYLLS